MITADDQDVIRKAELIYETQLKTQLEASHRNSFVAIEPVSGDFFVGSNLSEAANAARAAHPDRRSYIMRIGHRAALHIGSGQ